MAELAPTHLSKNRRRRINRQLQSNEHLKENNVDQVGNGKNDGQVGNGKEGCEGNYVAGIVLIMIVKNESRIIQRCLNSAKPILSGICITDTGSTDDTVDVIKEWADTNNISCEVPITSFRNFGYSRTESFINGRKCFPKASYYLLLDADMELIIRDDFDEKELTAAGYRIYQQNGTNRYQNIRLVKADKRWKCVGVTHEYWECDEDDHDTSFSLEINDRDDGGCKQDKYARDKRLLLEGLADRRTPDNLKQRYHFYLAQTYLCMKDYENSIREYQKRFDLGGWNEECWYSLFKIGTARMEMSTITDNKQDKEALEAQAIAAYLKAWNFRPCRAEPLQKLAEHYREKSMNELALKFAEIALSQGYPQKDGLFIDTPAYDYLLDFEVSINAFYVPGKKNLGLQSHRRLKNMYDKLPPYIQRTVDNNNKFYLC